MVLPADAQIIDPIIPSVDIYATVPVAKSPANPGVFTVYRTGLTTRDLNVYYRITGTASNGVDYAQIDSYVDIPAGAASANIDIVPLISTPVSAVKTVTLTLWNPPTLNPAPSFYRIGYPGYATVVIAGPGTSNLPPTVKIASPPDNSVFRAPVNISLYAYASDQYGTVSNVEFFVNGTNDLGPGRLLAVAEPLIVVPGRPYPLPMPTDFTLTWSNAPVGTNWAVTAVATDYIGSSATSAPVHLSVLAPPPPPPPPTNTSDFVGVVATDPIAVEGTNCWAWPVIPTASGDSPAALPCWSNWPPSSTGTPPIFQTNCGPKNAVFTVRRFGVLSNDLTVAYSLSGTASNGVDYMTLPGSITIPANSSSAMITIVPIDDGPPDVNKTVILSLTPSTSTPPDYVLGILPSKAEALILDGPWPRPLPGVLPDRSFHFAALGPDGAWFHIECTTDLVNWTTVCTNQVVQGSIDYNDPPDAAGGPFKWYRAVRETNTPAQ